MISLSDEVVDSMLVRVDELRYFRRGHKTLIIRHRFGVRLNIRHLISMEQNILDNYAREQLS